ncbi:arginine--tRNA ligase [Patescibacteria group bacterium]
MIRKTIIQSTAKVTGLKYDEIHLETPEREEHGDYSSNVALKIKSQKSKLKNKAQKEKDQIKSPQEIAEEIVEKLRKDKELQKMVEKIEVAGPGFINFHLTRSVLVRELGKIVKKGGGYGKTDNLGGKKIMVEYAHPNTHKEFHIGHLRNIVLAESINRLLECVGAEVVRANYQGDVGLHIAKALWGIEKLGFKDPKDVKERVKFLGQAYATGSKAYDDSEEVKNEIKEINNKIYSQDDEEINELYKETRQWSLDYFESIYKRVCTKFDRFYFESECYESGKKYSYEALEKGILRKSEGAIIFPGSEYGLHDRVFVTKD